MASRNETITAIILIVLLVASALLLQSLSSTGEAYKSPRIKVLIAESKAFGRQVPTRALISPLAERIELTVPFSTSELPYGMVPMGETVYHEKPYGHPGIDFRWRFPASVIKSAPGRIINISHEEHGWNVFVRWGNYVIGYLELAEIDPSLRIGDLLPRGAYVGRVGHAPGSPDWYHMFHWEFGYYNRHSPHPDRLCPMTYFRDADRWLIERIMGMGWEYSSEWPDVCNGYYADRHE